MTQEKKKQLLLKDLCTRLPYGVIVHNEEGYEGNLNSINQTIFGIELGVNITSAHHVDFQLDTCKPYLRPMSSATEEEKKEFIKFRWTTQDGEPRMYEWCDYANAHHFDYRGLIEKGLALEAPESMYKKRLNYNLWERF